MKNLIVNRLYHLTLGVNSLAASLFKYSNNGADTRKVYSEPNGMLQLGVSFWLSWEYLMYKCCCFCFLRKRNQFKSFLRVVEFGATNVETDMDIVRLLRRLRAHGLGLHFLLNHS